MPIESALPPGADLAGGAPVRLILTHSSHKGQKKAPPLAGDGSRAGLLPGKVVESERQDARDYMVNEKLWRPKESPAADQGIRRGCSSLDRLGSGLCDPSIFCPSGLAQKSASDGAVMAGGQGQALNSS